MKKQATGSGKAFFSKLGTSCNIQASAAESVYGKTAGMAGAAAAYKTATGNKTSSIYPVSDLANASGGRLYTDALISGGGSAYGALSRLAAAAEDEFNRARINRNNIQNIIDKCRK